MEHCAFDASAPTPELMEREARATQMERVRDLHLKDYRELFAAAEAVRDEVMFGVGGDEDAEEWVLECVMAFIRDMGEYLK